MKYPKYILLLLLLGCTSKTEKLPILSYSIKNSGEKNYYSITYEGFTNQLGNTFTTSSIENKIVLSNFFFTRCPSICPPMRMQLIDIANTFKNQSEVLLVSHTIDPEYDTIHILKSYAEDTEIPSEKWQFVRGSEAQTKAQAKQYMTNFKPNSDGSDFYHSSYVTLLDKKQRIRGFYNSLVPAEVSRLKADILTLLK